MNTLDDYDLADFMAGRLTPERRTEVIRYLASHEDAREWLRMSYQALEAGRQPAPRLHTLPRRTDARPAARVHPLGNVSRIAAVVALVLMVGAVLRVVIGPPGDQLRADTEQTVVLGVRVAPSSLAIEWNAVPEASRYEVIVWDEAAATTVASEIVIRPEVSASSDFTAQLRATLKPERTYAVRVTAFDEENRRLVTSELETFQHTD